MKQHVLALAACLRPETSGGKAVNLGSLIRAGLPVPDGFAITTDAWREAMRLGGDLSPALAGEIVAQWKALGSPAVAVRSSATAEDAPGASMAGQYETMLGVNDADALISAVRQCWHSLGTPRALAYLAEKGLDSSKVAMAVVVQRLVSADLAGVLFTVNPQSGDACEMLIEASWGLGESVVSGEVQPDSVVIAATDGAPLFSRIGSKATQRTSAHPAPHPTVPENAAALCLDSRQLHALWQLGRQVEHALGGPQDLEWAIQGEQLFLLQSRPITTLHTAPAALQRELREELAAATAAGQGPWVRHNLSETLPYPTPLTWNVIRRFMMGSGGYGVLQRLVGYAPGEIADREGVLDLLGGRIYLDLSRAGQMFHERFAYRYDEALLRRSPSAAQSQPTVPCGSRSDRIGTAKMLKQVRGRLAELDCGFVEKWETSTVPEWHKWVLSQSQEAVNRANWHEQWMTIERRVLDEFAPESLLPGFLAALHLDAVRTILGEHFFDENADALSLSLASGGDPDRTLAATADLRRVGLGEFSLEEWITLYGHRAPGEFDLASPRWRELPEKLAESARAMAAGPNPFERHEQEREKSDALFRRIHEALPPDVRPDFTREVEKLRAFSRLREDAKFELMRGYELLRRLITQAAGWLDLGPGDDVFFLEPDELHKSIETGLVPLERIRQRRARFTALRGLSLPLFLDVGWGESPSVASADPASSNCHTAFPISSGVVEGPVRIVHDPFAEQVDGEGFILVCPSTDPSWTPLFTRAAGLVLECGGALSHGAVVARELGLPAVVLENATTLLREGDTVRVDGSRGSVGPATGDASSVVTDAADHPAPNELPPPPDRIERRGSKIMLWSFVFWAVALGLAYGLAPRWMLDPVYAVFDALLLPLWQSIGLLAAPAAVALFFAVSITLAQRVLTNTARLNLAKRRAETLRSKAASTPAGSKLAASMRAAAKPVTGRILASSLVPLALFIGPMVLSFTWMTARLDPSSWPPDAGSRVHLTATVDGDYVDSISLSHNDDLELAASTPASRQLPPIRTTLVELLGELKSSANIPEESERPWPEIAAAAQAGDAMLADLEAYLGRAIPPGSIAWSLQSPDRPGAFHLSVLTGDHKPVPLRVAFGAGTAPEKRVPDGASLVQLWENPDPSHPVREVRIAFSGAQVRGAGTVWQPFARLGWPADFGWLGAYLAFYLPPFFLLRWLLRLP